MAIALNLTAPLLLTKAFAAGMVKNKVCFLATISNFTSTTLCQLGYTGSSYHLHCFVDVYFAFYPMVLPSASINRMAIKIKASSWSTCGFVLPLIIPQCRQHHIAFAAQAIVYKWFIHQFYQNVWGPLFKVMPQSRLRCAQDLKVITMHMLFLGLSLFSWAITLPWGPHMTDKIGPWQEQGRSGQAGLVQFHA